MSKVTKEVLLHISDEIDYLLKISRKIHKVSDIIENQTLKRAIVRSLEIIGEATKRLPKSFTNKNTDIEWKSMAGMRDKLIHDYFDVDYEIVFDVLKNKIPELKKELIDLLKTI